MTQEEKETYLYDKVYENIKENRNGTLSISTYYLRKVAKILGGNFDDLTKNQKLIFKNDVISENIYFAEEGMTKYSKY